MEWGMRFQPAKCNMMQLTGKLTNKIQASYTLDGVVLVEIYEMPLFFLVLEPGSDTYLSQDTL